MNSTDSKSATERWLLSGAQVCVSSLLGDKLGFAERMGPQMSLRADSTDVSVAHALGVADWYKNGPRKDIVLLMHGLFIDESNFLFRGAPLVTGLRKSAEWTPLLLRWNTGLSVHHSAELLAQLINEIAHEAGPALGRIHLVGHSMGGLLAKGVLHTLALSDPNVLERIESMWLLATPLTGAPMARWFTPTLIGGSTSWRPQLSEGIRDAGLGFFHPGQHAALAAGTPLAQARESLPTLDLPIRIYSIAGSLWPTTTLHPSGERHDGLVDTLSAAGGPLNERLVGAPNRFRELPMLAHQAVPISPRVLKLILKWREQDRAPDVFFTSL